MKEDTLTSDDILGKEAIDPDGSILGIITKVHIDKKTLKVLGITIDMGLLKPDLFIGSDFIKNFGRDTILLKKVPSEKYNGLSVLTESGKLIGKVKEAVLEKGKVKEFIIKSSKLLDGKYLISFKDIQHIGENIILKADHKLRKKE
jgi:uncharacterized protein YrrD